MILNKAKRISISVAVVLVMIAVPTASFAAPSVPSNLSVGGNTSKPTVTWQAAAGEPNGVDWAQVVADSGFDAREGYSSAVFDNKLWVMGGVNSSGIMLSDVWYSSDGETWTEATSSAGWSARGYHTSVVFDNKLWVMGGSRGSGNCSGSGVDECHDVWYSSDGETWTEATSSAGWGARTGHTSVVFDNKMWVLGGVFAGSDCNGGSISFCNDVWYSSDGETWTEATDDAEWPAHYNHASIVFDNKMWVLGGSTQSGAQNDVWYSSDGETWTEATNSADWAERDGHNAVVFDNKIWVLGGCDAGCNMVLGDVWYSSDGETWTEATNSADWAGRASWGTYTQVINEKIILLGGFDIDWNYTSEIWSTPNLSLSDYKLCWDIHLGGCSNTRLSPADEPLSYTLQTALSPGTWHFNIQAVNYNGDSSSSSGDVTWVVPSAGFNSDHQGSSTASTQPATASANDQSSEAEQDSDESAEEISPLYQASNKHDDDTTTHDQEEPASKTGRAVTLTAVGIVTVLGLAKLIAIAFRPH